MSSSPGMQKVTLSLVFGAGVGAGVGLAAAWAWTAAKSKKKDQEQATTTSSTTAALTLFRRDHFYKVRDGRRVYPRYADLIGCTELVDITALVSPEARARGVTVLGKVEFMNPSFSMKDRIAHNIIAHAEREGQLPRGGGGNVVCASSGNTGAAVAMVAAMRGHKALIITNEKCSKEKRKTILAYGAELQVATPHQNYMTMELEFAAANPGWFPINQYDSAMNPQAHELSMGPEIWNQTGGSITHFVMGGSTGGTMSGTGRFLKSMKASVRCVMPDPFGSVIFHRHKDRASTAKKGKWLVEGVGKGSIPGAMDLDVVDEVVRVSDTEAFAMCERLAKTTGLLVGGSAGLNVHAAVELANTVESKDAVIVTVLCDLGVKYLSKVYNKEWLKENGFPSSA